MNNVVELHARVAYDRAAAARRERTVLGEIRSVAAFAALLIGVAATLAAPALALWFLLS
ncbi:hypothetical protein JOD31_002987 [Methylopila capsulata]|uniref:Uncharacterized protein n=1 Tax=Methylopila capsulata TaxID=61654 RepID=A0A9W6IXH9_9HYPH|nr:hypothetical protein [Methylopila capsulata]MBM7852745.1 hypothetical protein [Methylopila capsulata]GLK56955.1 hypothetical protein GCM10008170_29740 [Methylopila capsulata]